LNEIILHFTRMYQYWKGICLSGEQIWLGCRWAASNADLG